MKGYLSAMFKHDLFAPFAHQHDGSSTSYLQELSAMVEQLIERWIKTPLRPILKPPLTHIPLLGRFFLKNLSYRVESKIDSPATEVIFTRSKRTRQKICLKRWQPWKDELYDTQDTATCNKYLLEGLSFNRRFAPNIYLGIAPIHTESLSSIDRGQLIAHPEKKKLAENIPYALVMKRLPEIQRLDHQLPLVYKNRQNVERYIAFLAASVASMHTQLEPSSLEFGSATHIAEKLSLNTSLYCRTLKDLADKNLLEEKSYKRVSEILEQACKQFHDDFERRYKLGHIKRCHGDLKATNLWVCRKYPLLPQKRLLALDCIDFRPEFCHIDTLSDVAMLAIDLEMHLTSSLGEEGRPYARRFLDEYMQQALEQEKITRALLEYYLTEKAMVFACISALYDGRPDWGKQYLDIALIHAQKLADILASTNISSTISGQRVASQA